MLTGKNELFTTIILYFSLLVVCSSPIWGTEYFINHDGSAHLYTAHVMRELLSGNPFFTDVLSLNSVAVPNSSGHWLIAALLTFFTPQNVTRIVLILSLAFFVGSIVWLRIRVRQYSDIEITVLFAFAVGLNWIWAQGSYNYILAAAGSTVALGLFFTWRERMTVLRTSVLLLLMVFVFISHFISFTVLVGGLLLMLIFAPADSRYRSSLSVAVALLPIIPMLLGYRRIGSAAEPFVPAWRSLSDPYSLSSWIRQFVSADPFVFISRKTFPFYSGDSYWFVIFSPLLWVFVAVVLIVLATLLSRRENRLDTKLLPFILLCAGSGVAAIFGPDDFGLMHGSILRERFLLSALIFLVPIPAIGAGGWLKFAVTGMLAFVIAFQTLALWEYAIDSDQKAREFLSVASAIPDNTSITSVTIMDDCMRFHSLPLSQIDNYIGVKRNILVWDNYEFGHYMFPVVTKDLAYREFAYSITVNGEFCRNNPAEDFDLTLARLASTLESGHQHLGYVIVNGSDSRLSAVLGRWFEPVTEHSNGPTTLYRHRDR